MTPGTGLYFSLLQFCAASGGGVALGVGRSDLGQHLAAAGVNDGGKQCGVGAELDA
jgi:hypothetical protein